MDQQQIAPPTGFHLMTPPGWQRFMADEVGKHAMISQLSSRMREANRPDLDAQARTLVEVQWRQLQKAKATAVYLPGARDDDTMTPMSIATRQFVAPPGIEFATALRDFAKTDLERVEVPWGEVFRWTSVQSGRKELKDVQARMLGYGFPVPGMPAPAPGAPGARGIVFLTSIPYLGDTDPELIQGLIDISDAIMDTFRWRE